MNNFDYHIHTQFSYDSCINGIDLLNKSILLGYQEIAITEHLDLLPQELSVYGLPSLTKYRDYCNDLKARFPQIKLYMGIEIGDYHLVRDFARSLIDGFDFCPILGSVHFLSDHCNVAIPMKKPLSKQQIEDYYRQNLDLVSHCDIDILAHLGVYKRYYRQSPDESHISSLVDDILTAIIHRNIALEINLSSLRKPLRSIIPEPWVINRYRQLGGKLISIGSDSHRIDHFEDIPSFVLELCADFLPPTF